MQTDATTPTLLGPAVHRGKDTTHKTLETMWNVRVPNNVERTVQTDPTLLRYASATTEQKKCWELLAQKFDWFQTLRNNSQQHATTCNRVCKRTQHLTFNNVGSCWPTIKRPFARVLKLTWLDISTPLLVFFTLVEMFCTKKKKNESIFREVN